ncbi:FAD-binding oxidoreductase [Kordiimonas sp. SCSIO 12610]|uniref:NAD(P)/FAD-dependent oxidoreductase n=1 Tax=Kordiimonas sp. SCSIO 12610 TaxID=2829597 RepID=UPI00210D1943|nr:FAD-dependent oxidoreductase [Kordiimonas sp. SCSIO 12610]UTW54753.1 FAD-dependent oxidoreductase [Kordiimonas sp. SCSIO 12610]
MTRNRSDNSVVIIGAGIIGLACAHYLAREGKKVVVLDSKTIGGGCSAGNCGHILPSHILPLNSASALKTGFLSLFDRSSAFRVKPQLNLNFISWMWSFARHCSSKHVLSATHHLQSILELSIAEYEDIINSEALDCDWQKSGLLYLFKDQKSLDQFSKTDEYLSENFKLKADYLDPNALQSFDPSLDTSLTGGFLYKQDAHLRPEKLIHTWTQKLREHGVTFVENCHVINFERTNDQVSKLMTTSGDIEVEQLVIATGAFSGQLAKMLNCSVPVIPGKGYSITFPKTTVAPKTSIVFPEENIALTPFKDHLRIGSMMEFVGFNTDIPDHRIQQLHSNIAPYFKDALPEQTSKGWFGWRPMSYDGLPIIGRLENTGNAFIATGHGMMGVMLAPATGRLISEIMTDKKRIISEMPYSPARF